MSRFRYLKLGLAGVLLFVGAKMLLSGVLKIPIGLSLAVIAVLLAASIGASLIASKRGLHEHPGDRKPTQLARKLSE